jgi:hypothetical protein
MVLLKRIYGTMESFPIFLCENDIFCRIKNTDYD